MSNADPSYLQIIYETFTVFTVLLILTRLLGKKQLSHLTYFNYITGITIGSIAANMVMIRDVSFYKELTALVLWVILSEFIGYIALKSYKLRNILDGEPSILIKKGKINKKTMKSLRINIDDLSMLLRQKDVFAISEVDYAILEPDGKLSILKKPEKQAPTKNDLNIISTTPLYIPTELIVDGKIIESNLTELNLSRCWLYKQLKKQNINSVCDVFYAEIDSSGSLFIDTYDE